MGWFGKKTPASPVSSRPSATVAPHTASTAPSRPTTGTALGEAVKGRTILKAVEHTQGTAQRAVNLLEEMTRPSEGERSGMDEIKELLETIVSKLGSIEDRLSAIERRQPALRVVPRD